MNISSISSQPIRLSLMIFALTAGLLLTGLIVRDVAAQGSYPMMGDPGCPIVYKASADAPLLDEVTYQRLRHVLYGYVATKGNPDTFTCPNSVVEFMSIMGNPQLSGPDEF